MAVLNLCNLVFIPKEVKGALGFFSRNLFGNLIYWGGAVSNREVFLYQIVFTVNIECFTLVTPGYYEISNLGACDMLKQILSEKGKKGIFESFTIFKKATI